MALYAIADLHLSGTAEKPMGRFGARWEGHAEKLRRRWSALVGPDDTVVIPGDFSWGIDLEETKADFLFLDTLPGRKIIGKGNHDYWWTSVKKMRRSLTDWGIGNVEFLFNNAFEAEGAVLCGTRGWFLEEKQQTAPEADFEKLMNRETIRLRQTLVAAEELRAGRDLPVLVFLHFPPVFGTFECRPFLDLLSSSGVRDVFYGHIHGRYDLPLTEERDGIRFTMISADALDFYPFRIGLPANKSRVSP